MKPLGRRSYIVESSGQFYVRNRRHLKRSAEDGNPLAVEELLSLMTDDQPAMEPVATSSVNQPKQTATIAVHKDQPSKACNDLCMGTNAMASKDEPSEHPESKCCWIMLKFVHRAEDWSDHLVVLGTL